jgi:RNA polymerase sigma factor (sigma-70 family)
MHPEKELIKRCLKGDRFAQELLYRRFAAKMYAVCMRYLKQPAESEDVLQESFIKIFQSLKDYRGDGSFEGWVRRIVINTTINHIRRNLVAYADTEDKYLENTIPEGYSIEADLSAQELLQLIHELPEGYRIVFNLYAIEGFTHAEIADMLGISVNTSKSQLSRARASLQKRLTKEMIPLLYERTA